MYAVSIGFLNCCSRFFESMPAVDQLQGAVIARFNAIFNNHVMLFSQAGKVFKFFIINTIGPRAYHQPDYPRKRKCFVVKGFQGVERCIGI